MTDQPANEAEAALLDIMRYALELLERLRSEEPDDDRALVMLIECVNRMLLRAGRGLGGDPDGTRSALALAIADQIATAWLNGEDIEQVAAAWLNKDNSG